MKLHTGISLFLSIMSFIALPFFNFNQPLTLVSIVLFIGYLVNIFIESENKKQLNLSIRNELKHLEERFDKKMSDYRDVTVRDMKDLSSKFSEVKLAAAPLKTQPRNQQEKYRF